MALLMEEEGPEGATPAPGSPEAGLSPAFITGTQSTGTTQYLAVDLEPGYYVLLCFVGDPTPGRRPTLIPRHDRNRAGRRLTPVPRLQTRAHDRTKDDPGCVAPGCLLFNWNGNPGSGATAPAPFTTEHPVDTTGTGTMTRVGVGSTVEWDVAVSVFSMLGVTPDSAWAAVRPDRSRRTSRWDSRERLSRCNSRRPGCSRSVGSCPRTCTLWSCRPPVGTTGRRCTSNRQGRVRIVASAAGEGRAVGRRIEATVARVEQVLAREADPVLVRDAGARGDCRPGRRCRSQCSGNGCTSRRSRRRRR